MSFFKRREVRPEELTCGPGCRCVRQFPVFDSVEADFRRTGVATCEEEADELVAKRAEHGFEPVRINRAGRCLVDWNEKLKAEKAWLYYPGLAVEDGERVAREQKLAEEQERKEREERENAELSRLVVEDSDRWMREVEAPRLERKDKERRKARFLGSFSKLKWL